MWSANGNMFSYIFLSTGFFRFSLLFFLFFLLSTVCLLGAGDVFSPRSITPENQISNADIISYQVYYPTQERERYREYTVGLFRLNRKGLARVMMDINNTKAFVYTCD
jgi:hypothetical protein